MGMAVGLDENVTRGAHLKRLFADVFGREVLTELGPRLRLLRENARANDVQLAVAPGAWRVNALPDWGWVWLE